MVFVLYDTTSGAMLGEVVRLPSPLAPGTAAVPYESIDWTSVEWDATQRLLVPRARARLLSKRQFMGRIPVAHFIALNAMRIDPSAPLLLRATLNTAAELRDMVNEIDLDDAGTQQFVPAATDALIGAGYVDAADRASYIEAWLADPA